MSNSLYDISVGSYIQTLSGMITVLNKGAEFAKDNKLNADDFVAMQLHDDMLPFLFQVSSVRLHSVDALTGLENGVFNAPKSTTPRNYQALIALMQDSLAELKLRSADQVNAYQGKPVIFKMGSYELPFIAENFILSFSLPNLNFHATTAYNILRAQGVPLGKVDFLGPMRIAV